MHNRVKKIAPIILIVVVVAVAVWYFLQKEQTEVANVLAASGTIEATELVVAPEIGGRVVEVLVNEGDTVTQGQVLLRYEDGLLQAQYKQAQAALALAQANFDLVASGMTAEQRQVAITTAQMEVLNSEYTLAELYEHANLRYALAFQAIAKAEKAVDLAQERLDNLTSPATQADIDAAQATVILARDKLDKAREDFERYVNKPEDNILRATFQSKLAAAQKEYDNAVARLNNLLGSASDIDQLLAEMDLFVAQAQLLEAQRDYEKLDKGIDPEDLELAQARLAMAKAHLDAANAEPSPEQLAVAQAQVDNAKATVGILQAQIDKLVITSPADGVVLNRIIEPGEVSSPGAALLTLGQLDKLSITVYIPEDLYGQIHLGLSARVKVDSFPGEVFFATVTNIADRAEYTPRNVQTVEGRRVTVFAIQLSIDNQDGKLKPGMPADVTFEQ